MLAERFVEWYYRYYRNFCADTTGTGKQWKIHRAHMAEDVRKMLSDYEREIGFRTSGVIASLGSHAYRHGTARNLAILSQMKSQAARKSSEIETKISTIGQRLRIVMRNTDKIFDSLEQEMYPKTIMFRFRKYVSRLLEKAEETLPTVRP
jgi:hypothetical protein